MTDFRALCADDAFAASFQSLGQYRTALLATLFQPESQEPTDEDIRDFAEYDYNFFRCDSSDNDGNKWLSWECDDVHLLAFARAVLARWGRPAIEPQQKAE